MSDRNSAFRTNHRSLVPSSNQLNDNGEAMNGKDAGIVLDDVGSYSSSTAYDANLEPVEFNSDDDFSNLATAFDPTSASQTLFNAVASKDYSSLVALYANHSIVSIVQFLQMKRRWTMEKTASHRRHRRKNDSIDDSDDIGAEEKLEELLQQSDHSNTQQQQMRTPYSYGVRGYSRPEERIGTSHGDEVYLRLLHELTIFLKEKSLRTPLAATSKKASGDDEKKRPINKKPKNTVSEASINSSMYEAERLLRDMAAILSDTQPPSNFVVYSPNSNSLSTSPQTTTGNIPPLFDGSVANATPPPGVGGGAAAATAAAAIAFAAAAGGGIGNSAVAGGGAGTILHLACALDVPLCLAFVLSMGADARACHTAFRRLLIHEAACNGSINCLKLLLELGQHYDDLCHKNKKAASKSNEGGLKSPDKSADFPFNCANRKRLVKRQESGRSISPSVSLSDFDNNLATTRFEAPRLRRILHIPGDHNFGEALLDQQDTSNSDDDTGEEEYDEMLRPLDFVSLLRLFRDLSRQVEAGAISELDAARKVMFHATIPDVSRNAIAKSCTYKRSDTASYESGMGRTNTSGTYNHPLGNNTLWRLPHANSGRSDGHGNTPLHWAAFKNETECVKLLLLYNADPDARANPSGWTPLHDAAYSNGHEAIRLLLDNGAQVDSRANSGATPLCFAAQEDAAEAAALLLERGADLTIRCAAAYNNNVGGENQPPVGSMSRFSGYTPLHYCAHYNAKNAARILLQHPNAKEAMEVTDFNERLPIHVAVARGSSDVLRELLRAGARVETRTLASQNSSESENSANVSASIASAVEPTARVVTPISMAPVNGPDNNSRPSTPLRRRMRNRSNSNDSFRSLPQTPNTPCVASPLLRSMIPSQPVVSTKPWNCLSQRSIDECRRLINEVEQNWTPDRHSIFTPIDRKAVAALLLVGKRFETERNMFVDVWPEILSFCGRGWFEKDAPEKDESMTDETETSLSSDYMDEDTIEGRYALSRSPNVGNSTNDLSLPTFC